MKMEILRCGSVLRFGAVFRKQESYGAVRFFRCRKSYGAVRCCDISCGVVRRGCPLHVFFYGAALLSVGKTVQHRFFSPVHRMKKPNRGFVRFARFFSGHERNLCFSTVPLRCTVLINRTNPRVRTVFCRFFTCRQSHQQQQVLGALKTGSINRFVHIIRKK